MSKLWKPHNYQKRAVRWLLKHPSAGLLLDPGLGKTAIVLQALVSLKKAGVLDSMLVVAPLFAAQHTWPAEVKKWKQFSHLKITVLHGPKKEELLNEPADVYVINYEGLTWLCRQRWKWPRMLVCDESTKIKDMRTQRFKALRQHLNKFWRRVALTGTPSPNGMLDLFGQLYMLDLGQRLGKYITYYRNTYFLSTGFGGYKWVPLPDTQDRVYRAIEDICLRMSNEEYLKLPALVKTNIEFDLGPRARAQYDQLQEEFFLALEEGAVDAVNAGVLSGKLRQVINGAVYNAQRKVLKVHDEKLAIIEDLVEEIGQPTLIAYEFQHDLDRLLKVFPDSGVLGGRVSKKKAAETIKAWNAGELGTMLVHPAAAGHGLNLQHGGHHIVWFGLTWNLEHYDQLIARIWRQGQKQRVFVYHILARKTLDPTVLKVLQQKDHGQKSLLAQLARRRRSK